MFPISKRLQIRRLKRKSRRSRNGGKSTDDGVSDWGSQLSTSTVSNSECTAVSSSPSSPENESASPKTRPGITNDDLRVSLESLVVVPLARRPLLPGFFSAAYVKNQPWLMSILSEDAKVATFMLKNADDFRGCIIREGLKGKELLDCLYHVGSLATVTRVNEETGSVGLLGQRRIRVVEVIWEEPLTVRAEILDEKPYKLDELNATQLEAAQEGFAAITELARGIKDDGLGKVYFKSRGWNAGFIADYTAATMPVYERELHQQVLEELDWGKRLELITSILEREMEMDRTDIWVPKPDDEYSEEERELLKDLMLPGTDSTFEMDQEFIFTGEVLMAPSVQMRVRLHSARECHYPAWAMKMLKLSHSRVRLGEHQWGY